MRDFLYFGNCILGSFDRVAGRVISVLCRRVLRCIAKPRRFNIRPRRRSLRKRGNRLAAVLRYTQGCRAVDRRENALNHIKRLSILAAAALLLLAACDNAVNPNKRVPYLIKGDPHSVLYPLDVKRDSEDVRIELKESAPVPEVFSVDASGRAVAFNFTVEGNTLIVPGKFDHLRLRYKGAEAIDIVSEDTVK
jgi:hypothetical protein